MRDYPIVKRVRELIADLQIFGEPDMGDIGMVLLGALPEWPVNDQGQHLDIENFSIYEITETGMLVSAGGDWEVAEMFWVDLNDGLLTYKKIEWDQNRNSLSNFDELEEIFTPSKEDKRDMDKEPIKIKRFEYDPARIYNPENRPLGIICNPEELADIRIQIRDKKLTGYYIYWRSQKILIDIEGGLSDWPIGFFDEMENRLNQLL